MSTLMNCTSYENNNKKQEHHEISRLEENRSRRKQEAQLKEDNEWNENQAMFLKNRLKKQEKQIEHLEELVVQLISRVEKTSNGEWKVNWTNI